MLDQYAAAAAAAANSSSERERDCGHLADEAALGALWAALGCSDADAATVPAIVRATLSHLLSRPWNAPLGAALAMHNWSAVGGFPASTDAALGAPGAEAGGAARAALRTMIEIRGFGAAGGADPAGGPEDAFPAVAWAPARVDADLAVEILLDDGRPHHSTHKMRVVFEQSPPAARPAHAYAFVKTLKNCIYGKVKQAYAVAPFAGPDARSAWAADGDGGLLVA